MLVTGVLQQANDTYYQLQWTCIVLRYKCLLFSLKLDRKYIFISHFYDKNAYSIEKKRTLLIFL